MKVFKVFLFVIAFSFLFSSHSISTGLGIGVTAGYLKSFHEFNYSYASNTIPKDICNCYKDGSGEGYYFGLNTQFNLNNELINIDLSPRLLYESMPVGKINPGDIYPSLVDDGNGGYKTINSSTAHVMTLKYQLISASVLAKISLEDFPVGIIAGPSLGYVINSNYKEKYDIVEPASVIFKRVPNNYPIPVRYENNDRTIVIYEGDLPESYKFRLGAVFGIFADIDLWFMTISPHILMDIGLTKVSKGKCGLLPCDVPENKDWKVHSLKGGLDIVIKL